MTDQSDVREQFERAIGEYDRPRAIDIALGAVDDGILPIEDLYRYLSQFLVDIGAAWQRGAEEVWQEHFASGVIRTVVESCAVRVERAAPVERKGTVILATPSDEYHDLGLRMISDGFTLAGWRSQYLGANVPIAELISAIEALNVDAVVLSAATHFHRVSVRPYVDALAVSHPSVNLWLVGSAFTHEHDGWPDEMILDPDAIPDPGGS